MHKLPPEKFSPSVKSNQLLVNSLDLEIDCQPRLKSSSPLLVQLRLISICLQTHSTRYNLQQLIRAVIFGIFMKKIHRFLNSDLIDTALCWMLYKL